MKSISEETKEAYKLYIESKTMSPTECAKFLVGDNQDKIDKILDQWQQAIKLLGPFR